MRTRIAVVLFLGFAFVAISGYDLGEIKEMKRAVRPMVYDVQAKKWVKLVLPSGTDVRLYCVQTACAVADTDFENNRMLLAPVVDPTKEKEKKESESGPDGIFRTQSLSF